MIKGASLIYFHLEQNIYSVTLTMGELSCLNTTQNPNLN